MTVMVLAVILLAVMALLEGDPGEGCVRPRVQTLLPRAFKRLVFDYRASFWQKRSSPNDFTLGLLLLPYQCPQNMGLLTA